MIMFINECYEHHSFEKLTLILLLFNKCNFHDKYFFKEMSIDVI